MPTANDLKSADYIDQIIRFAEGLLGLKFKRCLEKGDAPVFMFCIRTGLSRCVSYPKKEGSKVVFLSRPADHFPTLLMLNTLGRII